MELVKELIEAGKEMVGSDNSHSTSRAHMADARLPMAYRDSCAHLLIPLNKCRYDNYYLNWRCKDERHSYEKCQYEEFLERVRRMDEIRAAKGGQRSN
ncbi:putative NADH-ubiquinone oxidoreductase B18 subunit [Piedraia hortae CBS 480.64]|uniref:NADH dehydrogenase [ubiquinone] 1 beta subcomplex subunit 7 n=1 Tax=Piedraia hortae CBS 480.64 TaxID=1314780 RepID=A0A6A7BV61_9PEZI|nr:putative NADH-ubiquinone oxidoreductase B18 subunit [Piedraia hortae CBS 480.64]